MQEEARKPARLWQLVFVLLPSAALLGGGVLLWDSDPRASGLLCVLLAALAAVLRGFSWARAAEMARAGMARVLPGVEALLLVGAVMGVWMEAGVLPTLLHTCLSLFSRTLFLPGCALCCAACCFVTGSAWGTGAALGCAFLAAAEGSGIPAAAAAGAVVSGIYFGDQLSPRSETSTLACAVSGCTLEEHLRFQLPSALLPFALSLAAYALLGALYFGAPGDASAAGELTNALSHSFTLSPALLLPPLLVLVLAFFRLPLLLCLGCGLLTGGAAGLMLQPGCTFQTLCRAACTAPLPELRTGDEAVTALLRRGGMDGLLPGAILLLLAGAYFGLLEGSGLLDALTRRPSPASPTGFVAAAEGCCLLTGALLPEQYFALLLPGGLLTPRCRKLELHPVTLSCALECSGTVLSPLIPWSNCGVFLYGTLGLSALRYGPWAFYNLLTPLTNLLLALLGVSAANREGRRLGRRWEAPEEA